MARHRFRQDAQTGKLYEIFPTRARATSAAVHDDIQPFVSHVDGSLVNSKSDLREHNRRNGVTNDPDSLAEQTKRHLAREHYVGTSHERKLAIADAIERTESSGFHRNIQYDE